MGHEAEFANNFEWVVFWQVTGKKPVL